MADSKLPPPADPLRTLQGMFEGTMIQTGKFFQAATLNKENIGQAAKSLQAFLPSAQSRFNTALDELEIELLQVIAVFEQDLLAANAKRRSAEPPNAAEAVMTADTIPSPAKEIKSEGQAVEDPTQSAQVFPDREIMENATTEQPPIEPPVKATPDPSTGDTISNIKNFEGAISSDKKLSTSKLKETEASSKSTGETRAKTTEQPQEISLPAANHDMNFGSMFEAPEGGTTDINAADLDFLNDFKVDSVPEGQAGNTDLNSLLPGLESYANASTDDFTMVFPPTAASNNEGPAGANKTSTNIFDGMDMSSEFPAQESNFDDLFLDSGNLGNVGSGDDFMNDGMGEIGELDENLFDSFS